MILGHLTVTAAGYRSLKDRVKPVAALSLPLLVVGAYVPDLVDKPLHLFFDRPGRGYGHSLVVEGGALFLAWLLWPARRRAVATLAIGVCLHLLEDGVVPVVLFAPLLGPIPQQTTPWNFWKMLIWFYTGGSWQMWVEVASFVYWLAVVVGRRPKPDWPAAPVAPDRETIS